MNTNTTGDVTVIGLVHGAHIIADIGWEIPQGQAITIPGHLAHLSKDLWRGISQRLLFKLNSGIVGDTAAGPELMQEIRKLKEQLRLKDETIAGLEAEVYELKSKLHTQMLSSEKLLMDSGKLDDILNRLKDFPSVTYVPAPTHTIDMTVLASPGNGLVELAEPAYIPETIKPEVQDSQIEEVQKETSEKSSLAKASSKLRNLRKPKP